MTAMQQIQVARDRRTGFPVVRLRQTDPFVGLLPVTKLQAEQWIWEGGLRQQDDGAITTFLIRRMDHIDRSATTGKYPDKVQKLVRVPISQCSSDNLPSIVATNLSLWSTAEETLQPKVKYPTPSSEWGRLMRWLGAHVPSHKTWAFTRDDFAHHRTKGIIHGILQQNFSWPPVVQYLLNKLLELIADDDTGLPLMSLGVYELVSKVKVLEKHTVTPKEKISRPYVAGASAIWPTLETAYDKWRFVLASTLPVVTIRPWYEETQVIDQSYNGRANVFELPTLPLQPVEVEDLARKKPKTSHSRNGYVTTKVTMANRCPVCYGDVSPSVFQSESSLYCYEKAQDDGDRLPTHSQEKPSLIAGIHSLEAVHREYLTVARKAPQKIRSICLSGFSQAGKTVGLLSLWGLATYEMGNPDLLRMFPPDWNLRLTKCSLLNFIKGETLINIERQTELMWIDGELPVRTAALQRALRCPLLFETKRRQWLFNTSGQVILNFNDLAGELVVEPLQLEKNKLYPNLSSTTDVVFFTPAPDIAAAARYLAMFAGGLGIVKFQGKALDLKKINLILAITQIDKLKHSSDPDEEALLNIMLTEPCTLPRDRREHEFRDYIATMHSVHNRLASWLNSKTPQLVMDAARFASVRYCGFSACGFQPVNEKVRTNVEAWLPFGPKPVRVADPLLWLLHDNGLLTS